MNPINQRAQYLNKRLGVELYNEKNLYGLTLNIFTKKKIKELCIEDLVTPNQGKTRKLYKLQAEILEEYEF